MRHLHDLCLLLFAIFSNAAWPIQLKRCEKLLAECEQAK